MRSTFILLCLGLSSFAFGETVLYTDGDGKVAESYDPIPVSQTTCTWDKDTLKIDLLSEKKPNEVNLSLSFVKLPSAKETITLAIKGDPKATSFVRHVDENKAKWSTLFAFEPKPSCKVDLRTTSKNELEISFACTNLFKEKQAAYESDGGSLSFKSDDKSPITCPLPSKK